MSLVILLKSLRRELSERFGEKNLYEGGLTVRTTLDPKIQAFTRKALADGLVRFDEAHGFRGAVYHVDISSDWGVALAAVPALGDVRPWRLAVILELNDSGARIGLQPGREKSGDVSPDRETGVLSAEGMRWTGRNPKSAFTVGDVIYVEPLATRAETIACVRSQRSLAQWWRWTPTPAACFLWLADFLSTNHPLIAQLKRSVSLDLLSSPSFTQQRSTMATHPLRLSLMSQYPFSSLTAHIGPRKTLRADRGRAHILYVMASNIQKHDDSSSCQ